MKHINLLLLVLCGCEMIQPASIVLPPSPAGSGFNDVPANEQTQPSSAAVQPARDRSDEQLAEDIKFGVGEVLSQPLQDVTDSIRELSKKIDAIAAQNCPPNTTVEPKRLPDPATAPVVFYFLAPFPCGPCDKMLADIKNDKEFTWVKASSPWNRPYPGQQWQIRGQWTQGGIGVGWSSLAAFKATYRASLGVP